MENLEESMFESQSWGFNLLDKWIIVFSSISFLINSLFIHSWLPFLPVFILLFTPPKFPYHWPQLIGLWVDTWSQRNQSIGQVVPIRCLDCSDFSRVLIDLYLFTSSFLESVWDFFSLYPNMTWQMYRYFHCCHLELNLSTDGTCRLIVYIIIYDWSMNCYYANTL